MEAKFKYLIDWYKELFGLSNWDIVVLWHQTLTDGGGAKTFADPRYKRATIELSKYVKEHEDEWDKIIIHEFIHIVMALYDFFADNLGQEGSDKLFFVAREQSVSELTTVMLRILHKDYIPKATN